MPAPPYNTSSWLELYEYYIINCTDERVVHYPLLGGSPWGALAILIAYLLFVINGPKWMQHRKPWNLKHFLLIYNFALIALSGYMCYEFAVVSTLSGYSYSCQPIDYTFSRDPLSLRMVHANYLFFLSKIIELMDTVIFILRKKNSQVTFLHVYHHFGMVINWWLAAKFSPVGQCFFVGMVNSFVHTIMYTYYGLAGLGPHMQKYLWWKRYMTRLQLIQFVMILAHTSYNMFMVDCFYPWIFNEITFYYTLSIFFLFLNFYYQAYYVKAGKAAQAKSTHAAVANGKTLNGQPANHWSAKEFSNGTTNHVQNGVRHRPVNGKPQ